MSYLSGRGGGLGRNTRMGHRAEVAAWEERASEREGERERERAKNAGGITGNTICNEATKEGSRPRRLTHR